MRSLRIAAAVLALSLAGCRDADDDPIERKPIGRCVLGIVASLPEQSLVEAFDETGFSDGALYAALADLMAAGFVVPTPKGVKVNPELVGPKGEVHRGN